MLGPWEPFQKTFARVNKQSPHSYRKVDSRASRRYPYQGLLTFSSKILERLEVPGPDAAEVAGCLVSADLRGIHSHGVVRLPVYARRLQAKVVRPNPRIQSVHLSSSVAVVDGDNGLGPVVGSRAMELAMKIAADSGTGWVGARRSNHFGIAAHYVQKAVSEGMIGFACSNAPPNMAPYGGRQRFLGTNPFAVGIPAGEEASLVFDASSSVVARGKIIVAAQTGKAIPPGWAMDVEGRPTTDAREALQGAVLPFGGPKGSALSLIIDILCGVMTGAAFALHLNTLEDLKNEQNLGHVFFAMRTELFMPKTDFERRMDEMLRLLKASPPAVDVSRVLAPGEPEVQKEDENRKLGIPLPLEIIDQLAALGEELNLDFSSVCQ